MSTINNEPVLNATETVAGKVELATVAEILSAVSGVVMTPADFAASKSNTNNGYYKLPSGLTIQWGNKTSAGLTGSVSFPVAFSSSCFTVVTTCVETAGSSRYVGLGAVPTTSGFNYITQSSDVDNVLWIAIGV